MVSTEFDQTPQILTVYKRSHRHTIIQALVMSAENGKLNALALLARVEGSRPGRLPKRIELTLADSEVVLGGLARCRAVALEAPPVFQFQGSVKASKVDSLAENIVNAFGPSELDSLAIIADERDFPTRLS